MNRIPRKTIFELKDDIENAKDKLNKIKKGKIKVHKNDLHNLCMYLHQAEEVLTIKIKRGY